MKKILSLFLAIVTVMSVFSIVPFEVIAVEIDKAETSYTSGDYEYVLLSRFDVQIIDYTGNATEVSIPSQFGALKVTSIGNNAFDYSQKITSVTIPDGVTRIGYYAFSWCTNIKSITIPASVTSIGDAAFCGCSSLESITIPASVTSIGEDAFRYSSSLTSIKVDSNNKYYDSRDNCNAIIETSTNTLITGCKNTIIPSSVTSIGNRAFNGSSNLTSITIPEGVTNIGDSAFENCNSLKSITIYSNNCRFDFSFGGCVFPVSNDTKIYCFEGSTAEEYAKSHGIAYEFFCQNGHTEVIDKGYPATYGKDGLTDGSHCSACNKVLVKQEVIPRLGLIGDVDDDGDISIMDATAIQLHIARLVLIPDELLSNGDTDEDGDVSVMDATQIQLFIAQLIPEL